MKIFATLFLFLSATWLPHGQLCVTVEGTVSQTACFWFWPNGQQELCNEVGFLSPVECLKEFELETWFYYNALTQWATRARFQKDYFIRMRDTRLWPSTRADNSKFVPGVKYFKILVCCVETTSQISDKKNIFDRSLDL